METQSRRLVNFRLLYIVTQLIGVFILILIASWVGLYLQGFGWDYENVKSMFNWHPLCMTLGMIFLYGNCELIKTESLLEIFMITYFSSFFSHSRLSRIPIWTQEELEIDACNNSRLRFHVHSDWTYRCF